MKMEDNLNFQVYGRRPQFSGMEDDLNFEVSGKQPQFLALASPKLGTAQPQLVELF
jgi:hypothetical protein